MENNMKYINNWITQLYTRNQHNIVNHLYAVLYLVTQSCLTLCDPMDCGPTGSSVHGDSAGTNTEVGCHALLQGIFPTQESKWGLLHCRWILYQLSYLRIPNQLYFNIKKKIQYFPLHYTIKFKGQSPLLRLERKEKFSSKVELQQWN